MKRTQRFVSGLVACAITLAMVSPLSAQTAMEGVAKVVRVKGPARYTTGNNIWQPLNPGAILKPGTIIQTGKDSGSLVDIVLGDGNGAVPSPAVFNSSTPSASLSYQPGAAQNVVRIWANTALGVDKLTSVQTGAGLVTETQLDLRSSHISGTVKKMSAASKYEVKLPNCVAGIRGTTYDITTDGVIK